LIDNYLPTKTSLHQLYILHSFIKHNYCYPRIIYHIRVYDIIPEEYPTVPSVSAVAVLSVFYVRTCLSYW